MQWFRAYVGTHSDPKIATVARKVGLHRTIVLAVWLAIEECACAALDRGSMASMDFDDVATALDIESEQVHAIVVAFKAKGMISDDGVLTAWQKRQFQSDSDPTNAQRQRRHRDKSQSNASVTDDVTDTKRDVTTRDRTEQTQIRTESETEGKKDIAPSGASDFASEFDTFYEVFPAHKDRAKAFGAYRKARKKTDAATLLAGAERYRDDPNRNPSFTKYPASWLNAESWLDEISTGPPAQSRTMRALETLERRLG